MASGIRLAVSAETIILFADRAADGVAIAVNAAPTLWVRITPAEPVAVAVSAAWAIVFSTTPPDGAAVTVREPDRVRPFTIPPVRIVEASRSAPVLAPYDSVAEVKASATVPVAEIDCPLERVPAGVAAAAGPEVCIL